MARRTRRSPVLAGAIALVVLLIAALAAWLLVAGDDDDDEVDGEAAVTTTSDAETSTTADDTTTTTEAPPQPVSALAVWPYESTSLRYDDPRAAALGFAREFAGFADPQLGEFRQADARSGEVDIRPTADGPVTRVLVRQLGEEGTWWVIGATTDNIDVDAPDALEEVSSPVHVEGRALAFEGNVEVQVREDGSVEPIGTGFVTGSGGPEPGPFEGEIEFDEPSARRGAVVFRTTSARDGSVWELAVVRVAFAD